MALLPFLTFSILIVLFSVQILNDQPKPKSPKSSKDEAVAKLLKELLSEGEKLDKVRGN